LSGNLSGNYNTVQTLSAGTPTVNVSGTINAYGTVGQYIVDINGPTTFTAEAALFGPSSGHFTITNSGLIETHGTAPDNLFDVGIVLGAAGTLRNSGTILGGSGIAIFQSTGNSYVENSKLIEGLFGVGVVIFGNTSSSATVVNSGTIITSPTHDGGAIAIFGNGAVTNDAGGTLIADASYGIEGQSGALTVTNAGAITGFFGGINLQGGGFVANTGTIHETGTGTTLSNSSYAGINTDFGGTIFNSGTILGQNGIDVQYGDGTITSAIQGYVNNSGLIQAFSTNALQNTMSGPFGAGVILDMPGTAVNAGFITASNAGIYTQNGVADVQNLQAGTIVSQIGIDLSANTANGAQLANVGYVENSGIVQAYSATDINGNFTNGFPKIGVGVYLGAAGTVVNRGSIAGNHVGIVIENDPGTVTNTGTITSSRGYGVYLNVGGTVSNTGSIIGYEQGIFIGSPASNQAPVNSVRSIANDGFVDATAPIISTTVGSSTYAGLSTGLIVIGAGTIDNQANGLVEAKYGEGIFLYAADENYETGQVTPVDGSIVNAGTVEAQYGVYMYAIGSVTNTGTIIGTNFGLKLANDAAAGSNSGLIEATAGSYVLAGSTVSGVGTAVVLKGGGNFTNTSTGTLTAAAGYGVYLAAGGTLSNAGTINGHIAGVLLKQGGLVINSGTIDGTGSEANAIVALNAPLTVENSGLIIGTGTFSAIYMQDSGIFINHGTILGESSTPVYAGQSLAGTVVNYGLIQTTGTNVSGIYWVAGGTVTNNSLAVIAGYSHGVYIRGANIAAVTNTGTISGFGTQTTSGIGIGLYSTVENSVSNATAGVIEGVRTGISITNAAGTILNDGTVIGSSFCGVNLAAGGSVNNAGMLAGGTSGIYLSDGMVTNSGTILGSRYGISSYLSQTRSVVVTNSGLIEGGTGRFVNIHGFTAGSVGVFIGNGGTVTNTTSGTVTAAYAVYFKNGGTINNAGSLIGQYLGVSGATYVTNTGFITELTPVPYTETAGSFGVGTFDPYGVILFDSGGTVHNAVSGTISAGYTGVYAFDGSVFNDGLITGGVGGVALQGGGLVVNSGTIAGSGRDAVALQSGGTVQNSNVIAGTNFGIYDLNGVSDIRNTGSITGADNGILAFSASSYVYNSGSISASNTVFTLDGEAGFATGIALLSSGTVNNASAGVITGRIGIGLEGTSGTASTIINAGLVNGNYLGVSSTDFVSLTNSHIIEALGTAIVTDAAPPYAGPPFSGYPFAGIGVALSAGGNITNEAGATITGYDTGVYIIGGSGVERSVTNDGVIKALGGTFGTAYASGVAMVDGGEVTNLADGTISGLFGVYLASGTVTNAGTITETGPGGAAVYIAGSGEIVDDPGAVFGGIVAFGAGGGLELAAGGAEGTLGGFGTQFLGFVAVTVDSAAVWDIAGATSLANYITLTNDGTLKETSADALTISGAVVGAGTIILDPTTMTLDGSVSARQVISFANAGDVLDLGDPSQFDGTISGLGLDDTIILDGFSEISDGYGNKRLTLTGAGGAETLDIAGSFAAADFTVTTLAGSTTISLDVLSGITVSGSVAQTVGSGVTIFTPTLVSGVLDLTGGTVVAPVLVSSTLDIGAEGVISGAISLSGSGSNLIIEPDSGGSTTIPANTITGFTAGDTIELAGVTFTGTGGTYGAAVEDTYTVATAGTLTIDADGTIYNLLIADATIGQDNFVLSGDLGITETACYAAGTHIATAVGEMKVEDLEIGDYVETLDGSLQKIKWIGRRSYDGRFIAGNKDVLPICIAKGAIGDDIPWRDLFVSPGHAICIDGALIHAFRLVNGVSITQVSSVDSVTYYHIETENHEVIFAENCPAETFLDENFRAQFQNAAEFHALYPNQSSTNTTCLPLLEDGFALHAIQQRLNARAGVLPPPETHGALRGYVDEPGPEICSGWAQDLENPETPVCLDILVDGARIARVLANLYRADLRDAGIGSGCHAFRAPLPAGLSGRLEIRRASDGAALPWTETALTLAA
jgi:hypothetical protein